MPKIAVFVAIILAIIVLIILAIVFFVDANNSLRSATGWAIFLGIFALIIAILLIYYLVRHRQRINYSAVFLEAATKFLK